MNRAKGDESDLANLGLFICHYAAQNEWITKNVKEWVWIYEDEGNENMIQNKKYSWLAVKANDVFARKRY